MDADLEAGHEAVEEPGDLFRPGKPLPDSERRVKERTLYHARRADGQWATMLRDNHVWQWRILHGDLADGYGVGTWRQMQQWLMQGQKTAS